MFSPFSCDKVPILYTAIKALHYFLKTFLKIYVSYLILPLNNLIWNLIVFFFLTLKNTSFAMREWVTYTEDSGKTEVLKSNYGEA